MGFGGGGWWWVGGGWTPFFIFFTKQYICCFILPSVKSFVSKMSSWVTNYMHNNYGMHLLISYPTLHDSFLKPPHYNDVIMSAIASQITRLTIVYSTAYSGPDQRKYQSSASLDFVRGIHRRPVNSPHKGPVKRENVSIWWRHHGWNEDMEQLWQPAGNIGCKPYLNLKHIMLVKKAPGKWTYAKTARNYYTALARIPPMHHYHYLPSSL